MHVDFLIKSFLKNSEKQAIIWKNKAFTYKWLLNSYKFWLNELEKKSIPSGSIVVIEADFSPNAIALLLVLINKNAIIVPITESVRSKKDEFIQIAEAEIIIKVNKKDEIDIKTVNKKSNHQFYEELKSRENPGLVLFSSGSTGKSKASVHDLTFLLHCFY